METVRLARAVLVELQNALGETVRATQIAATLRSQGTASLPPQTLRRILGGLVPVLGERTWHVDAELLEALDAAARPEAADPGGRTESAEAARIASLPAGLPTAIRVCLRSKVLTLDGLVEELMRRGWSIVTPEMVSNSLRSYPSAFVEAGEGWTTAAGADSVQFAEPGRKESRSQDRGLPMLPAEAELPLAVVVTKEELASLKLPPEPEMRELFLRIFKETKLAQMKAAMREGALEGVWIAGRGELYHYSRDCSRIWGGRAAAVERGQGNSWVKQVTEHEAQELQRDPCPQCTKGSGTLGRR